DQDWASRRPRAHLPGGSIQGVGLRQPQQVGWCHRWPEHLLALYEIRFQRGSLAQFGRPWFAAKYAWIWPQADTGIDKRRAADSAAADAVDVVVVPEVEEPDRRTAAHQWYRTGRAPADCRWSSDSCPAAAPGHAPGRRRFARRAPVA